MISNSLSESALLKRGVFYSILVFYTLSGLFIGNEIWAEHTKNIKRVLIIHPYSEVGEWSVEFNSAFNIEKIQDDSNTEILIYYYFLNSDIRLENNDEAAVKDLQRLNSRNNIDIVAAVLPPSHQFLIKHEDELFPENPKIFVPATSKYIEQIKGRDDFFYIKSSSSGAIKETISDMKKMLPKLEHLYVYSGVGVTDVPYLNIFKEIAATQFDEKIIEYWLGIPIDELTAELRTLPDNSAIMLLTTSINNRGENEYIYNIFQDFFGAANAPVFSFYDMLFGSGIIGGALTSPSEYARETINIINLINTDNTDKIDISVENIVKKYDWRQLKRWDIKLSSVPEDAEILFVEETLWNRYKTAIIITFLIIFIEGTTIIMLVRQMNQKRIIHHRLINQHEKVTRTLHEKETLLKEVHHRVRNNLALMQSFIALQSNLVKEKDVTDILSKLQNRVNSMALVHEQLYSNVRIEKIDISEYLNKLCLLLIRNNNSENKIYFYIDIDKHYLDMNTMIPLGLIFNELITNSLSHAFNNITAPEIRISGKCIDNVFHFVYSDNGTGLPNDLFSGKKGSLGILIVKSLSNQLNSSFEIDVENRILLSVPVRI